MSELPSNLKYTASHEWVLDNGDGTVTVGITDHAQTLLGDVVYVELPEMGSRVERGKEFAVVESVKAASDLYAPVSGEVVAVNEALEGAPETVNNAPYSEGWVVKVRVSDSAELTSLLDAQGYAATLGD
ncbi:glycine cleavage system protein GcvH [Neopusillimonas maritima]|jgi:glycine cleavage system H protein|uniref:Glycine cleavage system H protein n=1 Tax=Neopusillimonas maritima TaxID=2026239 RepID=A0A3A1YVN9_9BURK|nr:glycine cleavage system protein GcvH [Neopusillimonas maritima]RIY41349.1 glycine cleavage system protein H [Neopusillimonas maritima]